MTDYNERRNINTTSEQDNGIGNGTVNRRWGAGAATSHPPDDAGHGHGSSTPQWDRTTSVHGSQQRLNERSNQNATSAPGGGSQQTPAEIPPPQDGTPHLDTHPATGTDGPFWRSINATTPESAPQRSDQSTSSTNQSQRRAHKRPPRGKKSKGAMKIAMLNMKGGGSALTEVKWELINQLMREEKIDVLTLQETHMSSELRERMNNKYGLRIHIFLSALEETSNAAGVAIVINKRTIPWKETTCEEIINGRALLVDIPWNEHFNMRILTVYAPNAVNENTSFWESLQAKWDGKPGRPNCILGDFNMVEDSVDRSPSHKDNLNQTQALADLKNLLRVSDGWRRENPTTTDFSFKMEGRDIMSRIDRIYIREDLIPFTNSWDIKRTGIRTDHSLVTAEIMNPWLPHQGKGRYAMPVFVLEQKDLIAKIKKLGITFLNDLTRVVNDRETNRNPQTLHKTFKEDVVKCVRAFTKTLTPKIDKTITRLRNEKTDTLNDRSRSEEERRGDASLLNERIRELEAIKFGRVRDNVASNFHLEGETIGKTWLRANKETKPRDIIAAQRDPWIQGSPLTRKSKDMAEIMRSHHERLQTKDSPENNDGHGDQIDFVLSHLDQKLTEGQKREMNDLLNEDDIRNALNSLPDGKAAGLDGIINELWKKLSKMHDNKNQPGNPSFDIVRALTIVFQDIQKFGVSECTGFAEGWLCPLYKKGDRTDPGNYRPITVLNTDYKIFTKALSMKLTNVAPSLIHKDQAGFMRGRRIEDHTELAKLVIDWAEMSETNGLVVCLDQEKAYDKILHSFLWATLRKMNFPESFIRSIQGIYAGATTVIMVNGEMSRPFLVIRGVRQGDPLSCLLFNLAIESLAQMLRKSDLKGIRVSDTLERVITTLFADDTTVYLAEDDSFHSLESTLQDWCDASGGKFNVPKTVITPVGTEIFRSSFISARATKIPMAPIHDSIHITKDGEASRLLGAFIGNKVDNPSVWTPTKERISKELDLWNRRNPMIHGRRLVVNMVVGGLTQYRTSVQGMSRDVEGLITAQIRNFIWNSVSTPAVNTQTLTRPIEEGGLGLLDLKARNEAIDLMRLKRYMIMDDERPAWAHVADEILRKVVTRGSRVLDKETYVNPFIQTIKINTRVGEDRLPASLKRMITTARKHDVSFAPLLLSTELMKKVPIWFHPGLADRKRIQYNAEWAKCLRKTHGIVSVGDLQALCKLNDEEHLTGSADCDCRPCREGRSKGCQNPGKCKAKGKTLLDMLGNRWDPRKRGTMRTVDEDEWRRIQDCPTKRVFNPDITTTGSLDEGIRVFVGRDQEPIPGNITYPSRPEDGNDITQTVYTDGSCTQNGAVTAKAGAGVWFGQNDARNSAVRVPEKWEQTNNTGEALAVAIAGSTADPEATLIIATDSKITMDGLTSHLKKWEDVGWIGVANKQILQRAAGILRMRRGATLFEKVKGHSNIRGNDEADRLAGEGAQKEAPDDFPDVGAIGFLNVGVKLNCATQALLYKGIKEREATKERRQTTINLDKTRWAAERANSGPPTDKRIWKSLRD